jgi:hypothetical protein
MKSWLIDTFFIDAIMNTRYFQSVHEKTVPVPLVQGQSSRMHDKLVRDVGTQEFPPGPDGPVEPLIVLLSPLSVAARPWGSVSDNDEP